MNTITIYNTINSEFLQIPELKNLIGQQVQIKITPVLINEKNNTNSKLGSYDLGGQFDNINIRDFAHEN